MITSPNEVARRRSWIAIAALMIATQLAGCMEDCPAPSISAQPNSGAPPANSQTGKMLEGRWEAGTHYQVLAKPTKSDEGVPEGIEVIEFFNYSCMHCYALEAYLVIWERHAKPADVHLVRIPVMWHQNQQAYARLFYTLSALARTDLHGEVFDVIHRRGETLVGADEKQSFDKQLAFAVARGIDPKVFANAYYSAAVLADTERARRAAKTMGVDHVPTIVVNRKYRTDVRLAGNQERKLVQLISALTKQEGSLR